jgi:hypothetical protein
MIEKIYIKNANRVSGGLKGRKDGYNYEDEVLDILKLNPKIAYQILSIKYKFNIDEYNYPLLTILKDQDKKAIEILITANKKDNSDMKYAGLDSKKPTGSTCTQWMRKRIDMFLQNADINTKEVFQKYFTYSDHKRTLLSFSKEEESLFF